MNRGLMVVVVAHLVTGCGGTHDDRRPIGREQLASQRNLAKDAAISRQIRQALLNDGDSDVHNVYVRAWNGKVTVRGAVETTAEREQVLHAARSVPGVQSINDELHVVETNVPAKERAPVR